MQGALEALKKEARKGRLTAPEALVNVAFDTVRDGKYLKVQAYGNIAKRAKDAPSPSYAGASYEPAPTKVYQGDTMGAAIIYGLIDLVKWAARFSIKHKKIVGPIVLLLIALTILGPFIVLGLGVIGGLGYFFWRKKKAKQVAEDSEEQEILHAALKRWANDDY